MIWEIRLKGQSGINRTKFKFCEWERETWSIPFEAIWDPWAKVITLENLRGDIEENKAALAVVWSDSEIPESMIHGFWLVID